jgi:hypothetical protein
METTVPKPTTPSVRCATTVVAAMLNKERKLTESKATIQTGRCMLGLYIASKQGVDVFLESWTELLVIIFRLVSQEQASCKLSQLAY